jgi:uncharacterized membrane protein HdeD (DUF308 family)
MKKEVQQCECNHHGCHKCHGAMMLLLGALILLNEYYTYVSWAYFIGGILALKGLMKILMPKCHHKE